MKPTVSVIIPCYNYAHYLADALKSVLAQTYTDWEAIVVDDGSTDNTSDVATAFTDPRIRYLYQDNQGESVARNRGVMEASGHYIAFLDADDIWLPNKLSKQLSYLEENPEVGVVFCGARYIDAEGTLLPDVDSNEGSRSQEISFRDLSLGNCVGGGSVTVIREPLWDEVGGFDRSIQFGEDWDLYLRAVLVTRICGIAEPLVHVRVHKGGQWRLPRPDTVGRVLEDHLRLLERAFSLRSRQDSVPSSLRSRAIAREYATAALNSYAVGSTVVARDHLQQAMSLDPVTWTDPDRLAFQIAQTALILSQGRREEARIVQRYVETVLHNLPDDLLGSLRAKAVEARAHIEVGYHLHACGARRTAGHHILRGLLLDPSWLSNWGTTALALELLLGRRLVKIIRNLLAGERHA